MVKTERVVSIVSWAANDAHVVNVPPQLEMDIQAVCIKGLGELYFS